MLQDRILLDTNLISEAQKPRPLTEVADWFASLGSDTIALPFPVVFEAEYGIRLKQPDDPARARSLLAWLDELLATDIHCPEMTIEVARLYARMAACPPMKHFWCPDLSPDNKRKRLKFGCDPMIAAISIIHRIPIATMNVRDFIAIDEFFPIPGIYNPARDEWAIDPPIGWALQMNANDDRADDGKVIRLVR